MGQTGGGRGWKAGFRPTLDPGDASPFAFVCACTQWCYCLMRQLLQAKIRSLARHPGPQIIGIADCGSNLARDATRVVACALSPRQEGRDRTAISSPGAVV